MSELIDTRDNRAAIRWKLLTGASALALAAYVSGPAVARAADASRPQIWIELGGQLERIDGKEEAFVPPFALKPVPDYVMQTPSPNVFAPVSAAEAQKHSIYDFGEEARLTFQPEGSKWIFSAGVRYGRSSNNRDFHHQITATSQYPNPFPPTPSQPATKTLRVPLFADFKPDNSERHTILDFQAGYDVGLGRFSSQASLGVRFADFSSNSEIEMIARPNATEYVHRLGRVYLHRAKHTDYFASAYNDRSFHGVGPSISWSGNVPVAGNEDGALTLDWGINAAALFGRQRAKGSHKSSANFYKGAGLGYSTQIADNPAVPHDRSRSVMVPNAGVTAAISYRYPGAKVTFGYRADMFFNALDMGIDARDTKTRAFYGPFATISIGIGD